MTVTGKTDLVSAGFAKTFGPIIVNDQMIQAGVGALLQVSQSDEAQIVEKVYRAMEAARLIAT